MPLEALSSELFVVAAALARLAEREALRRDSAASEPATAREVRALIAARRSRTEVFGLDLVHPGWSLLLRLYLAHLEEQGIRISRLRSESGLATATALRWLEQLCDAGWAERKAAENRAGGVVVQLTPAGAATMQSHLQAIKAGWIIA